MKSLRRVLTVVMMLMVLFAAAVPVLADTEEGTEAVASEDAVAEEAASESENNTVGDKAMAAAIVVGLAAATGAIGMGWAIAKSVEGISRQPEAEGKIRTTLMLGLVFVETAIIYALVIAILIIFVL